MKLVKNIGKHGQHYSHIGNRNFPENSCQRTIKSGSVTRCWKSEVSAKILLTFFSKTFFLRYFNIFHFCLVWSLTGKTLLVVTLCTLERLASFCTFWGTRIPVSDIAPSSPATLLGRWQYSWKYHTLWCRSILTAAWAFDVWTSSDDFKQILQNIPVLLLILFSRDTTLGYIRGCFSFKVKQKVPQRTTFHLSAFFDRTWHFGSWQISLHFLSPGSSVSYNAIFAIKTICSGVKPWSYALKLRLRLNFSLFWGFLLSWSLQAFKLKVKICLRIIRDTPISPSWSTTPYMHMTRVRI